MVEQTELFDFTNYPSRWAFTTRRLKGKLTTMAVGFYAHSQGNCYEVEFEFRDKEWVRNYAVSYDNGEPVELPGEVVVDLYREFAHHKAKFLARRGKRQLEGEFTRSQRKMN
jgi:hypothetical protein